MFSVRPLQAATVVSTFNTSSPAYTAGGYGISFGGIPPFFILDTQWAMAFTVPSGPNFTFIDFVVPFTFSGSTVQIDFTLASDAADSPGVPIETFAIALSAGSAIYSANSVFQPTLVAGTTYWLEAAIDPAFSGSSATWNSPVNILTGLFPGQEANRTLPMRPTWSVGQGTQAAFEIDGNTIATVPEPAYSWVFAALLFCVARVAKSGTKRPYALRQYFVKVRKPPVEEEY